jgi:hypothetical protein
MKILRPISQGKLNKACNIIGLLLLWPALAQAGQVQTAWLTTYNNHLTNWQHKAIAMALDHHGNVCVAGNSQNAQSNLDYAILKYAPSGTAHWVARYDSGGGTNDLVRGLAVDKDGNVILTGTSVTVKYNSDGVEQWTAPYGGRALAADTNGNVHVTGFSEVDFATVKLNATGSNVWLRTYNYDGGISVTNPIDISQAIAVDASGEHVYVAGIVPWSCDRFGCYWQFAALKYSAVGALQWFTNYYPLQYLAGSEVRKIVLGSDNSIYITGNLRGGNGKIFLTSRISALGQVAWVKYLIPAIPEGVTDAMMGSGERLFLTGAYIKDVDFIVYETFKLNVNGGVLWQREYGPNNGYHKANAIALDTNGNVYVTGQSTGIGTGQDWATIKYDPDGNQLWAIREDGPAHGDDEAVAIAVDNAGAVYVTGWQTVPGGGTEIVTIKYAELQNIQRQPNGAVRLQYFAPVGQPYGFQVSSNLLDWEPLATVLTDSNNIASFDDTNAPLNTARFYRGMSP